MTGKKHRGRRAYLNDFHQDEQGNYSYEGAVYECRGGKKGFQRELAGLWGLCAGMLAGVIGAGFVMAPGASGCFYILLPYTAALVFGLGSAWGLWRLTGGGHPLRSYIYDASIARLPARAMGTLLGTAGAAVGELVFLAGNGAGGKAGESLLFLAGNVLGAVCSALLGKKIQKTRGNLKKM